MLAVRRQLAAGYSRFVADLLADRQCRTRLLLRCFFARGKRRAPRVTERAGEEVNLWPEHARVVAGVLSLEEAAELLEARGHFRGVQVRVSYPDAPDFCVASHLSVCLSCGREYGRHPPDWYSPGWQERPWLHVLCDGSLVKL